MLTNKSYAHLHEPTVEANLRTVASPAGRRTTINIAKETTDTCTFDSQLEIGMPLTGYNNLAEGPLLRDLGHLRWHHLSQVLGIPSKKIKNADDERVYATFFYVDVSFSPAKPMSRFIENDRFLIHSTLSQSLGFLDGVHYLIPSDFGKGVVPPENLSDAVDRGIPYVRMANSFVKRFRGASWLKRSKPVNAGFKNIPHANSLDFLSGLNQVKDGGVFQMPPKDFVPVTEKTKRITYRISPERDVNGVGLVYFANYPLITDICERKVLRQILGEQDGIDDMLDRRSIIRRESAYYSNANYHDRLYVDFDICRTTMHPETPRKQRLHINARMYRTSDHRLMYSMTALKEIDERTYPFPEKANHVTETLKGV